MSKKECAQNLTKFNDVCNHYGGKEHWSSNCHKPKSTTESAYLAVKDQSTNEHENRKVFMVNHLPKIYPGLLLDCATLCYMFANQQFFTSYEPLKNKYVTVGGSYRVFVKGHSIVKFHTKLHNDQ